MSVFQSCTVYCGSSFGASPRYRDIAEEMGRLIASQGIELVYGGGNVGLMGALGDAAMEAGGRVLGIIPHFMAELERAHLGLTQLVRVKDMQTRKREMLLKGDAFIALPGGIGTLEEIMEALEWTCSGRHSKPVGFVNVSGIYAPVSDMLRNAVREGFLPEACLQQVVIADTPAEVFARLQSLIRTNTSGMAKAPATPGVHVAANDLTTPAAHDALAVIMDESLGGSEALRSVVEQFAGLAGKAYPRIVTNGLGLGFLSYVFVSIAADSNAHLIGVAEGSDSTRGHPGFKTLDLVTASSAEELPQARKHRLFEHGGQFIALPGGVAVWEEFLELFCASQLGRHTYPLGILNSYKFFNPLLEVIKNTVKAGFTEPEVMSYVVVSESPEDLLQQLKSYNPTRIDKMVRPAPHQLSSLASKL